MVQGLKAAGYTCAEVKQAGYTLAEMKQGGYTCAEARQVGYTCAEARQAGFVEGLKAAGYTCAEAKQAGFNPRECMQAGFTFKEGIAAGFPDFVNYPGSSSYWSAGKPPPRIEPRLTLAARALRLRAHPSARRGGPRPPPCRGACGPRPVCGPPAWRARAADSRPLVRAWRPRVAAQGLMTRMGTTLVDSAACPRGTAPPCRTSTLWACGHQPQHPALREVGGGGCQHGAGRRQEHESASRKRPISPAEQQLAVKNG
jgi:hypothetical protein